MIFILLACILLPIEHHTTRDVAGWQVHIDRRLAADKPQQTARALELLEAQLKEIKRVVPSRAVGHLQKVPLWFSRTYSGVSPRAEYHPGAGWLKDNGRNVAMVKSIEFTNIDIFEAESRRMPNFTLHELAHAYHDRVLPDGFNNAVIKAAYERAKAGGKYNRVERQDSEGRKTQDRAYALTNPQEYFAETTEAYFSRNDFYPYVRSELENHDHAAVVMLKQLWGN